MALSANSALAVLGLTTASTAHEVRKSYLRLAREAHPDKGGDPVRFCRIRQAWELLSHHRPHEPKLTKTAKGRCGPKRREQTRRVVPKRAAPAARRLATLYTDQFASETSLLAKAFKVLAPRTDQLQHRRKGTMAQFSSVRMCLSPDVSATPRHPARSVGTQRDVLPLHSSARCGLPGHDRLLMLMLQLRSRRGQARREFFKELPRNDARELKKFLRDQCRGSSDHERDECLTHKTASHRGDHHGLTSAQGVPTENTPAGSRKSALDATINIEDVESLVARIGEVPREDRRSLIERLPASTRLALQEHMLTKRKAAQ